VIWIRPPQIKDYLVARPEDGTGQNELSNGQIADKIAEGVKQVQARCADCDLRKRRKCSTFVHGIDNTIARVFMRDKTPLEARSLIFDYAVCDPSLYTEPRDEEILAIVREIRYIEYNNLSR